MECKDKTQYLEQANGNVDKNPKEEDDERMKV